MSNIVVPELGESVVEARISRWLKKAGDRVEVGEPVVHLETEKVDLEVNAEKPGVIASIARKEGDDVKIGEVLGVIDESGASVTAAPGGGNGAKQTATAPTSESKATPTREAPVAPISESKVAPATDSPVAPARVSTPAPASESKPAPAPTGESRIAPAPERPVVPTREARIAPTSDRPVGARSEERQRMSKRRQTIARRLVEAQHSAAMLTTFNEADMSAVMALRERQKESFKKDFGVGLGIASFFVKASV